MCLFCVMLHQAMARLSSASTESDYVPAMVPFHWEAAPGRPALPEIVDAPSLPLPPGKRPKDGFYLPFSRPALSPNLHNEAGGINSSSRERRSLNLKLPSLSSRITSLGRCLSHGRKGSSLHNHHTGRRLAPIKDSREKEIREPYPTPNPSTASGSFISSSTSHGHGRKRNSSGAGGRKQLQVPISRVMASMLMSLCPAESDESEAVDAEDEIIDDCEDDFSFSEPLTMPRARISSPDAIFQPPQRGVAVDPTSPTVTPHDEWTRAWVDMSIDISRYEEPAITDLQCEHGGSSKLLQPRTSLGTDEFTYKLGQGYAAADHKGSVADAHSVRGIQASQKREVRPRPTTESCKSSLSWKPSNQIRKWQDPLAVLEKSSEQEPVPWSSRGDSEYSVITSYSTDTPKVNAARRSTCCNATPTAEPSFFQRNSLEEQPELNRPPILSLPRTVLQNKAQVTAPKDYRIKENLKEPSTSKVWLESLKSSSLWPHPAPKSSTRAATNGDSDDESDNGSTESSEYEFPRAVLQTPCNTPTLSNFVPPSKPVIWEISGNLLKSSSLLKYKQRQQQSHESPRSSFTVDQESTALPSPNDSKGADLAVVSPGNLSETSKSNSVAMSKVTQWESNAGVGSSGKSLPIYLSRRNSITITGFVVAK